MVSPFARLTSASLCLPNLENTSACSLYLGRAKPFLDESLADRAMQAVTDVERRSAQGETTFA